MWKVWNKVKGRCVKPFYRHTLPAQYLGSNKINIARFAKAALNKCPWMSISNVSPVCPLYSVCKQIRVSCAQCTCELFALVVEVTMPMAEYATSWQTDSIAKKCRVKKVTKKWGAPPYQSCSFLDIVQKGGVVIFMFKKCRFRKGVW